MNLFKALRVSSQPLVAFVGAGGKTTAMFKLARELKPPVIVTATTHLAAEQAKLADRHLPVQSTSELQNFYAAETAVTLITGPVKAERTEPLNPVVLSWLREKCEANGWPLLIEADGSRSQPLKAPAEHEPPIPAFVDLVVVVAGLSGLGRPVSEEWIHRPEIFASLAETQPGKTVSPQDVVLVLSHAEGGLKNIPAGARRVALLNQADNADLQAAAGKMARQLLPAFKTVVVASLKQNMIYSAHEEVAGIILAAGASQRFGRTKQLLDWRGQPFVRAVARTALAAGLSPVIVLTGADSQNVEAALSGLPIQIVRNEDWREGQASSIRAGVSQLAASNESGAAIFLLVDQPQVTASILNALVEAHSLALPPVLAPLVMDQRANPVLFDRVTFGDLLELKGDVGGRAIFSKYRIEYLPWHDDRLLLDVDTPEQYARLVSDNTL
ncbi:MAG TPA: selenium cofactor biosynthesis protein YqeC [Anaerolineales bacterium]